ncbi:g1942 [Coccomyxa viridis]|uniref:G1942 protein n=1 Tax=Coccomyxa viridis TaxID=1274662 RepID=A0ABP1FJ60_9CHLO
MEELWGRCDFTSDLKLGDNFHCKEDITRWLSKRLPGFTQLICNTKHHWQPSCYQSPEELARATDAAAWLLTQLPVFRIDCMTGSKLHVAISLDLSRRLLRPGGIEHPHHALDNLWPAHSDSLVELSIVIHATDATRCIAAVNQLKSLTSLDVSVHPRSYRGDELADEIFFSDIEPSSHSITLVNWYKFNSDNMAALKHITEEVGGKVSVKAEMMGEDFMKPWNADMDESFCRSFL